MEFASIEREIHVEASPEVVFEVISSPEHLKEWWPDDADVQPTPGYTGDLVWGERGSPDAAVEQITVVQAEPPRLFSFRWIYPEGELENSLLVTFELVPVGSGTTVRLTETGFREKGWELAVLEQTYQDHIRGWDDAVTRLAAYFERLASVR